MARSNSGGSVAAIEVYYVAADKGGWRTASLVKKGMTVSEFLKEKLGRGYNASDYQIRVNREAVEQDYVLEADDIISVSPAKIEGASSVS